jgi:hypothetical protein
MKKQSLIKIQEYAASSVFELEVVESEDCTQEMDDIVGNINMMETGYGNLTGMNRHLAKEKQHVFEEAKKFYVGHNRGGNAEFGSMDFEEAMNNHSMILPSGGSFIMNNRSMNNLGGSQIFNDMQSSPNNFLNPQSQMNHMQFNQRHTRLPSNISRSQVMNSNNFNPNSSMHNPNYFNQTMNSQVFNNNPGYSVPKPRPQQNYGRRQTIRASVLQMYNKMATINQNLNQSMMSSKYSQKNLGRLNGNKNISIYTKSNLSNLETNRVNI